MPLKTILKLPLIVLAGLLFGIAGVFYVVFIISGGLLFKVIGIEP